MSRALEKYGHLTPGGDVSVNLSQEEACVVLFVQAHSVDNLSIEDQVTLDRLINKLKDQIWP